MKTNEKILKNTEKYRKTLKGVITNIYNHQKERSKNKGFKIGYSLIQFQEFCIQNEKFIKIYNYWKDNGYKVFLKPSIDRIDCLKGYEFGNIQVMTFGENRAKGDKEKEILCGKKIIQLDLFGNKIKEFNSIKQAVTETGLWQGNISMCLLGKRNHTGGFIWRYK